MEAPNELVSYLTDELVLQGHEVILFVSGNSSFAKSAST
jgi:hypothetical protein